MSTLQPSGGGWSCSGLRPHSVSSSSPGSRESILAESRGCSHFVQTNQDVQRHLEEEGRQEEARREVAPGVQAGTTLRPEVAACGRETPPSTLSLPYQAQKLPAKEDPVGGRMGSEGGVSVPWEAESHWRPPGLGEKSPHDDESTGRGQGGPLPHTGLGTGRGAGPSSSAPRASGGPWPCCVRVRAHPEGLQAWGQDEAEPEPPLPCSPGQAGPSDPRLLPHLEAERHHVVAVIPTGPLPSPKVLLPGAVP